MTRRELTLQLLQDAGPNGVTTADFLEAGAGSRFGARVQELRDQGHHITSERIRNGSYRYELEGLAEGSGEVGGVPRPAEGRQNREGSTPSPSASLFDLAPVSGTKSSITGNPL